jgi:trigger factor
VKYCVFTTETVQEGKHKMNAKWEKIEKNEGVLHVEVEAERVAEALDQAFKKVVNKVNVPGFRKGKVPRKVFEIRFGVESLYQDALDILLPEVYGEAIDQTGIEPIDRPEVDIEQMEKGQNLVFKAKVLVKPEVELGQYKGLEIEAKDFSVKPEDIDAELEQMRARNAEVVVLEEGSIEDGDIAMIDFEGFIGDEAFAGGKGENYSLEIGSKSFIPGFEEQLVGLSKGDEKEVVVTFPEEYHAEELAGKEATFKAKVNDIKRKKLPALDDEFAKDVSEFETLDELRQDIEKRVKERKEQEAEAYRQDSVVNLASENATVDVPEVMVRNEIDHMLEDFGRRLQTQGMNLELYYQFSGQNEEALKTQFREDASKRVRNNLVLEAISKAENIEAAEADIEGELEKLADAYQKSVDELRTLLGAGDGLATLKNDLVIRKTIEFLVNETKQTA